MRVRSLSSRVLKWPDAETVDQGVRRWAQSLAAQHSDVLRIGYFGSYARGDWGVGSDVDLIIIVGSSDEPFERRAAQFAASRLPVPVDLLVYTSDEWEALSRQGAFAATVEREARWIFPS